VQVRVNDLPIGVWNFRYKAGTEPYQVYTATIPKKALDQPIPQTIWFQVSGARSPSGLGMGGDPRMLGMAVVRMRIIPHP